MSLLDSIKGAVSKEGVADLASSALSNLGDVKVVSTDEGKGKQLLANVTDALKKLNLGDKVALVTDSGKAQELGISEFPALVVAGKVISAGKILKSEEIQKLLSKLPGKKG
ncbi:MAG: thioredoxin family protein [Oscillospiraceae bacterium]|nr:thioredoxin family protein [Oscillospiraceae bacterium]